MKRIVILISLLVSFCTLWAQDTINPFLMSSITPTILRDSSFRYSILLGSEGDSVIYEGRCHTSRHVLPNSVVTGLNIAMKFSNMAVRDSLEVRGVLLMVHNNDFQHPVCYFTRPVTAVSHRPYDHYMSFEHPSMCEETDTVVPVYSLYFEHPIQVSDTVYLGRIVTRQGGGYFGVGLVYRNYIHDCDTNIIREDFLGVNWWVDDSLRLVPMDVDWPVSNSIIECIFPIYAIPDTDSFSCPEVEGFAFAGINAGAATLMWDTADGHTLYQIAYGPYDKPIDSLRIDTTSRRFMELFGLSQDIYYQARLRAKCHHACPLHDTVMWTAWTDPVYFYTGDQMPDTSHQQPIGIASASASMNFAIVPNPTRKGEMPDVVIDPGVPLQGLTLTLHDAAGREVLHTAVSTHRFALPVRSLPTGVYTATLSSPQGQSTLRIIIE